MLHEIYCEQFHQKRIVFNPGLSVVLGTNAGDNSIGKSTFLLIVDYVFGGSTYAGTTDIIENVGSHDIYFSFIFGEEIFKFCRNSINAHTVWKCNDSYEKVEEIGLNDYCKSGCDGFPDDRYGNATAAGMIVGYGILDHCSVNSESLRNRKTLPPKTDDIISLRGSVFRPSKCNGRTRSSKHGSRPLPAGRRRLSSIRSTVAREF